MDNFPTITQYIEAAGLDSDRLYESEAASILSTIVSLDVSIHHFHKNNGVDGSLIDDLRELRSAKREELIEKYYINYEPNLVIPYI